MSDLPDLPAPRRATRTDPALPLAAPAALHVADGVATVLLNRPERGNALSAVLVEWLLGVLQRVFADRGVHTLALAGSGRHLCTGFDLGAIDDASDGDLLLRFVRIEALLDAVWRAPINTVGIATGRTWGAGADLFAACDLRLAAPGASFRFPGAGFGLVLGTRRLAERVGTERARAWVGTGMTIDARDATAAGLASRMLDDVEAADAVAALDAVPGADPAARLAGAAGLVRACLPEPPAVDRDTLAALRAASRPAGGPGADALADADLAALVRSAARPGLKDRLLAYREQTRTRPNREDMRWK